MNQTLPIRNFLVVGAVLSATLAAAPPAAAQPEQVPPQAQRSGITAAYGAGVALSSFDSDLQESELEVGFTATLFVGFFLTPDIAVGGHFVSSAYYESLDPPATYQINHLGLGGQYWATDELSVSASAGVAILSDGFFSELDIATEVGLSFTVGADYSIYTAPSGAGAIRLGLELQPFFYDGARVISTIASAGWQMF